MKKLGYFIIGVLALPFIAAIEIGKALNEAFGEPVGQIAEWGEQIVKKVKK